MKNRALLSALALCFLVAACESKKATEPPKPTTAAVVPLPPAAPTAPAASAKQDAQPVQVAQAAAKVFCENGAHCEVEVTVTDVSGGCTMAKNPDRTLVKKGHAETIKWRMAGGSTWQLDKIVFTKPNSPFTCQANGPQIHCHTPNSETSFVEYPYVVHVKKGAQKCSTDPMIVNGADTSTP
jgi:hypothetical protein